MPTSEGSSSQGRTGPAQRIGSRLPEAALTGLREAFAEEVSERLPRLRAAAVTLDPDLLCDALRDLHTLGSSAYVVGADDAARTAREAETALVEKHPWAEFVGLVGELDARLAGWVR